MAAGDFAVALRFGCVYQQSRHSHGISDTVYITLQTHLIGERTTDH